MLARGWVLTHTDYNKFTDGIQTQSDHKKVSDSLTWRLYNISTKATKVSSLDHTAVLKFNLV